MNLSMRSKYCLLKTETFKLCSEESLGVSTEDTASKNPVSDAYLRLGAVSNLGNK